MDPTQLLEMVAANSGATGWLQWVNTGLLMLSVILSAGLRLAVFRLSKRVTMVEEQQGIKENQTPATA